MNQGDIRAWEEFRLAREIPRVNHTQESKKKKKKMVATVTNVLSDTHVAKQNDDYNNIAQMVESAALENTAAAAFTQGSAPY